MRSFQFLLICAFFSSLGFSQHFSVGIKGGVPLTDAFSDTRGGQFHFFSDSKEYVIGPMVELHLPLGLSVEADALYHPLNLATDTTSNSYGSWEFPILGKFRLSFPIVKPYVEAGPSFRTISHFNDLSNSGFTAGAGVELKLIRIRIAPEIRYTRWGGNGADFPTLYNVNQAVFLVGISF